MAKIICPHCGKEIDDDEALMCLYCGEDLERGIGVLGKMKYSTHWIIVGALIAICISVVLIIAVW